MSTQDRPDQAAAVVYVDPTCPFAWITAQWLAEVEREAGVSVRRELMSLAVVNEGRDLTPEYRELVELAWVPARVAAALLASPHAALWPAFYEAFGHRRHVEGLTDDAVNLPATLADLGIPTDDAAALLAAGERTDFDDDVRARTAVARQPLGDIGGTPVLHVGGRAFFGPVLSSIPRGAEAVRVWEAMTVLADTAAFSEIKGVRDPALSTS